MNIATAGTEAQTEAEDSTKLARETQTLRHLQADVTREMQEIEGELPDARRRALGGVPGAELRVTALEIRREQLKAENARLDAEHLQKTQASAAREGDWAQRQNLAREFGLTPAQAQQLDGKTVKELRAHAQQLATTGAAETYTFQTAKDVAW